MAVTHVLAEFVPEPLDVDHGDVVHLAVRDRPDGDDLLADRQRLELRLLQHLDDPLPTGELAL